MTKKTRKLNPKRVMWVLIVSGILLVLLSTFLLVKNSRSFAILGGLFKDNDQGKTVINDREPEPAETDPSGETVTMERIRKGSLLLPEAILPESSVPETNLNILLIGPDVSESNYDTLMIASINLENHSITLINIPRDIYVPYSAQTISEIKQVSRNYSKNSALNKINAAHLLGDMMDYGNGQGPLGSSAIDFVADVVSEMFHLYIDDYIYVEPSTFREIVDDFGGVTIDVPYRMRYNDPFQDLNIDLQPGMQLLNGHQAEGFVRYRRGFTDSGRVTGISDNERKVNQVAFMKAFASEHFNIGNIGKFIGLLENAENYLKTSIDNNRLTAYASYAKSFAKSAYTIESIEVPTSDLYMGGVSFLYLVVEGQNGFVLADGSSPEQTVKQEAQVTAETTATVLPEETSSETQEDSLPVETIPAETDTPDEVAQPTDTNETGAPDPGWDEGVPTDTTLTNETDTV